VSKIAFGPHLHARRPRVAAAVMLMLVGCPRSPEPQTNANAPPDAAPTASAPRIDSGGTVADRLRERLAGCARQVSAGRFKSDDEPGAPADIPICELGEALYWNADLDIDCDGEPTKVCNVARDPAFQPQTAATTSKGRYLNAEVVPYVVIPSPSALFDGPAHGIDLGTVALVVHRDRIEYGVIGDLGPPSIIGEASYAMAARLGIDPDPATGGTAERVLYIAFKGEASKITKNEDHAEAVRVGARRLRAVFPDL
jgi:hypothetical protein